MNEDEKLTTRIVPEIMLDEIYIAMLEAEGRIGEGNQTALLRRCLNYLESKHGYLPPRHRVIEENDV